MKDLTPIIARLQYLEANASLFESVKKIKPGAWRQQSSNDSNRAK